MGLVFKLDKDMKKGDYRLADAKAAKLMFDGAASASRVIGKVFLWIVAFLLAAAAVALFVKAVMYFYRLF